MPITTLPEEITLTQTPVPGTAQKLIAERLARFNEMMAVIDAMPDYRAEAGLGPVPGNIREMAYEERESQIP